MAQEPGPMMRESASVSGLRAILKYPIPFVALAGLALGAAATWAYDLPYLGSDIWLLTLLVGGIPIAVKTLWGLIRGRLAADIIAMLAIVAAIVFDEGFAGTIIVLMQSGGEALEDYGLRRASSALGALTARAPRSATRKDGASTKVVPVTEVRPGDILLVRRGELVPVDGIVTSGGADIDESAITGEPLPRSKSKGDDLLGGSVNVGGVLEMESTKLAGESQYSKIIRLVRRAQEGKPRIQRLADRYAVWFTPLVIGVAAFGVVLTSEPRTLLSVLVVATPCPLILATPIAVISGVNRAASDGIIVKSGAALEQVSGTQAVVFDKTGTLTYGVPSVERVVPLGDWGEDDLMLWASALEQLSSHPIAVSLATAGRNRFQNLPVPSSFSEVQSRGVEGEVLSHHVAVGLRKFCEEKTAGPFPSADSLNASGLGKPGMLVTFVSVDGLPAGVIVFTDRMRPGVPGMVARLGELGVREVVMLTGDNRENAEAIAAQAGVTSFEANLLPVQKVRHVESLISNVGPTVMVGDGINDAPALASATVGIAMGSKGAGISSEAADMVLLVDDVTRVPDAIVTGKKMDRIARQGINFGLGASLVLMGIAAFGAIEPALGAILQEVIDVSVILNALRVR